MNLSAGRLSVIIDINISVNNYAAKNRIWLGECCLQKQGCLFFRGAIRDSHRHITSRARRGVITAGQAPALSSAKRPNIDLVYLNSCLYRGTYYVHNQPGMRFHWPEKYPQRESYCSGFRTARRETGIRARIGFRRSESAHPAVRRTTAGLPTEGSS